MIELFCTVISNNLIYVPYNINCDYKDMTYSSYIGSVNHSQAESVNIHVQRQNADYDLNIYSIGLSHLNYVYDKYEIKNEYLPIDNENNKV